MKKIIIITGQTATGKTAFALQLAKKNNGEIISVDSRQAYTDFDITTGKDLSLFQNIPIWMYGIYSPKEQINVIDYLDRVKKIIDEIESRGKLPILVGGSIFYIKTFLYGIENAGIELNEELRAELNTFSVQELQQKLKKRNTSRYEKMNNSDSQNPRRLIRAIEIEEAKKQKILIPFEGIVEDKKYKIRIISFSGQKEYITQQIEKRVDTRLKNGALQEVQKALEKYKGTEPGFNTLGVKQLKKAIEGKTSLKDAREEWIREEVDYARRQNTFLKKVPIDLQLDPTVNSLIEKEEVFIYNWLHAKD